MTSDAPLTPESFIDTAEGFTFVVEDSGHSRPATALEIQLRAALDAARAERDETAENFRQARQDFYVELQKVRDRAFAQEAGRRAAERKVAALREALEQAVLLEHDPRLSDEENAELLRRAEIARAALAAGQLLGGERPVCAGDKTR